MGIQDLLTHLKKLNPDIVKKISASKYSGKRLGLDVYLWLYTNISVVQKNVLKETNISENEVDRDKVFNILVRTFLDFYIKWCDANVQLILCCDGPHPEKKVKTHKKRSDAKDKIRERIKLLENKISTSDILDLNISDIDELKKLKAQINYISKDEMKKIKEIIKILGIPYLMSSGEGEKLCATLSIEGITAGSVGKDSDLLPYGNRYILTGLSFAGENLEGKKFYNVEQIDLYEALQTLDLTFPMFIDYCIALGCDYNDRIPGYGAVKCLNLIKDKKNLDNVLMDITILDHQYCRSEFLYTPFNKMILEHSENIDYFNFKQIEQNIDILTEIVGEKTEKYIEVINKSHQNLKIEEVKRVIQIVGKPKLNIV